MYTCTYACPHSHSLVQRVESREKYASTLVLLLHADVPWLWPCVLCVPKALISTDPCNPHLMIVAVSAAAAQCMQSTARAQAHHSPAFGLLWLQLKANIRFKTALLLTHYHHNTQKLHREARWKRLAVPTYSFGPETSQPRQRTTLSTLQSISLLVWLFLWMLQSSSCRNVKTRTKKRISVFS